ncbi:MAG: AI-2E family transporter, partial [Candidatus Marinimicrobia bacterium]|nr:AI-2E family transporter [Candidatus Neomarinimicrobiota bacterium]
MPIDTKPYTFDTVFRGILKIISAITFIFILHYLRDVLIPFAIALLLAYLMDPLVRIIQNRVRSRPLSVFFTLISIVSFVVALFSIIIPAIVKEVNYAAQLSSDFFNNSQISDRVAQYLPQGIWQAVKDWVLSPEIQDLIKAENIFPVLEGFSKNVLPGAWGLITGTANVLFWILGIAFVMLYLVFILMDFDKLRNIWKDMLPPLYRDDIVEFISQFNGALHRYFRAQAAIAGIVGTLFAIGFEVVGLPLGMLLGLIIGL